MPGISFTLCLSHRVKVLVSSWYCLVFDLLVSSLLPGVVCLARAGELGMADNIMQVNMTCMKLIGNWAVGYSVLLSSG